MKNVLLILGGVAVGGVGAYFFCRARQKKKEQIILSTLKDEETKSELENMFNKTLSEINK